MNGTFDFNEFVTGSYGGTPLGYDAIDTMYNKRPRDFPEYDFPNKTPKPTISGTDITLGVPIWSLASEGKLQVPSQRQILFKLDDRFWPDGYRPEVGNLTWFHPFTLQQFLTTQYNRYSLEDPVVIQPEIIAFLRSVRRNPMALLSKKKSTLINYEKYYKYVFLDPYNVVTVIRAAGPSYSENMRNTLIKEQQIDGNNTVEDIIEEDTIILEMNGYSIQSPVHTRYSMNSNGEQSAIEETLLRHGKEMMVYYDGGFNGTIVTGKVNTIYECAVIPFKKLEKDGFVSDPRPGQRLGSVGVMKSDTKATKCDLVAYALKGFNTDTYNDYMNHAEMIPINVTSCF